MELVSKESCDKCYSLKRKGDIYKVNYCNDSRSPHPQEDVNLDWCCDRFQLNPKWRNSKALAATKNEGG